MDDKSRQEMMSYYDERAPEYDEVYSGKGPAILHPAIYEDDVAEIGKMLSLFGKGHLIDIGCGTGFWLSYYARNCSRITLIDQSEKVLLECRRRVHELKIENKCRLVQRDFFEFTSKDCDFDSAIAGFFVSHLFLDIEHRFFLKLNRILKPNAQLILIDSAWNKKRQQYSKKEAVQERVLNDSRIFNVYKRYLDRSDIEEMFEKYSFRVQSSYVGDAFLAIIGRSQE